MLHRRRVAEHAWNGFCCSVEAWRWTALALQKTSPANPLCKRVCSSEASEETSDDEIKDMLPPYEKVDWVQTMIVRKKGHDVLMDPIFNQGTAFSHTERERLGIRGLLPPKVSNLTEQKKNIMRDYYKGIAYVGPDEIENWAISRCGRHS